MWTVHAAVTSRAVHATRHPRQAYESCIPKHAGYDMGCQQNTRRSCCMVSGTSACAAAAPGSAAARCHGRSADGAATSGSACVRAHVPLYLGLYDFISCTEQRMGRGCGEQGGRDTTEQVQMLRMPWPTSLTLAQLLLLRQPCAKRGARTFS